MQFAREGMPRQLIYIALCLTSVTQYTKASDQTDEMIVLNIKQQGETVSGKPLLVEAVDNNEAQLFCPSSKYHLPLKEVDAHHWRCELKKGHRYIIGWKSKTGWFQKKMIGYSSPVFTAQEEGQTVVFEPGMPSVFDYDLTKLPDYIRNFPIIVRLDKIGADGKPYIPGEQLQIDVSKREAVRFTDLAGGTYQLWAWTNREKAYDPSLYDKRIITIDSGKVNRFDPIFPKLDTTVEPNDVTIHGIVQDAKEGILKNEPVHLWMLRCDEKGTLINSDLYYKSVSTDSEGEFVFNGLLPNRDVYLYCRNDSLFLSRKSLSDNVNIDVTFVLGQKSLPLKIGQQLIFPGFKRPDGTKGNQDSLKGKVLVIDLWATWCGPCLRAMPEFNNLAKELSSDEVCFVTISIDSDFEFWKKVLSREKWVALTHIWFDGEQNDFQYQTDGIPYCVIVDKEGIIRAKGHGVDIRSEIEKIKQMQIKQTE